MALFDIFKKQPAEEDERLKAKAAFEKVANLESEGHEARSMRLGMSMLCRAHLDKTFVAGEIAKLKPVIEAAGKFAD